jgi:hypothetical protein
MSKVYVVTRGDYSDYTIRAVFLDKTLADEFAEKDGQRYDEADVEEWDVFDEIPARESWLRMEHILPFTEQECRTDERTWVEWAHEPHLSKDLEHHVLAGAPFRGKKEHYFSVAGRDHARVRKVFADHLAQMHAHQQGLT